MNFVNNMTEEAFNLMLSKSGRVWTLELDNSAGKMYTSNDGYAVTYKRNGLVEDADDILKLPHFLTVSKQECKKPMLKKIVNISFELDPDKTYSDNDWKIKIQLTSNLVVFDLHWQDKTEPTHTFSCSLDELENALKELKEIEAKNIKSQVAQELLT